jgi:Phage protein Gp138 N-terminal domain
MLQDERLTHPYPALRNAFQGEQRKLWTALPAIVQAASPVVAADGTITCVPALKGRIRNLAGDESDVQLPPLIKVPVVCFGGGGFSITAPLAASDEVLVVFASRCLDAWWQNGGVQTQLELRLHSLSDGMAIPGLRSMPRALANYSPTTLQVRSDDGTTYVELAGGGIVNVVAPTGIKLTTPYLHCTGAVVAGFGTGDQVGLQTHTHTQPNDSHGDTEEPTNAPTAGT